jgi:hypothetical protein
LMLLLVAQVMICSSWRNPTPVILTRAPALTLIVSALASAACAVRTLAALPTQSMKPSIKLAHSRKRFDCARILFLPCYVTGGYGTEDT